MYTQAQHKTKPNPIFLNKNPTGQRQSTPKHPGHCSPSPTPLTPFFCTVFPPPLQTPQKPHQTSFIITPTLPSPPPHLILTKSTQAAKLSISRQKEFGRLRSKQAIQRPEIKWESKRETQGTIKMK